MIKIQSVFSGFSVDNLDKAKDFYTNVLGLAVAREEMGLTLQLPDGGRIFVYSKENHEHATFTVVNIVVENIDVAVDELTKSGVIFERYEGFPFQQDEKGIARGLSVKKGPDIAWFKDPAGNIFSVLQDK